LDENRQNFSGGGGKVRKKKKKSSENPGSTNRPSQPQKRGKETVKGSSKIKKKTKLRAWSG